MHAAKDKKAEDHNRIERMAEKVKRKKGKLAKKGDVRAMEVSIEGRGMEKFI